MVLNRMSTCSESWSVNLTWPENYITIINFQSWKSLHVIFFFWTIIGFKLRLRMSFTKFVFNWDDLLFKFVMTKIVDSKSYSLDSILLIRQRTFSCLFQTLFVSYSIFRTCFYLSFGFLFAYYCGSVLNDFKNSKFTENSNSYFVLGIINSKQMSKSLQFQELKPDE